MGRRGAPPSRFTNCQFGLYRGFVKFLSEVGRSWRSWLHRFPIRCNCDGHLNRNEFFTAAFSGSPFDGVDKAPPEFMYAPAGQHFVCGDRDGETTMLHVLVDPSTVANLNSALKAHQARGLKPYFDFNHAEAEASAWPTEFCWKDGASPGVYVKCAWSDPGNAAITGKSWRTFSPAIVPDKWMSDEKNPSKIIGSPLIMGGLVNNPAFKKIAPLWAKNTESNPMQKTADELQADLAAAQTEISTLKARRQNLGHRRRCRRAQGQKQRA